MINKLYSQLIEPRSKDPNTRTREVVLNYLLLGSFFLIIAESLTALFGLIVFQHYYLGGRLMFMVIVGLLVAGLYLFARLRQQQTWAAFIFVTIFLLLASFVVFHWGTVTPTGVLLFGLVIVMAGVLLGARYSVYFALFIAVLLSCLELAKINGLVHPDLAWMDRPSSMSDVLAFTAIYITIALISWLFNRQMEQSLQRAQRSEAALSRQKALLEVKVEERTRQLEAAQLEKIQQIYRFAELGRISSALFHDLANHLTSVSLDIEGLEPRGRSKIMRRIQDDIHYIDEVVQRVRFQLRGQTKIEEFNISQEIAQVIKILKYKSVQARVTIEVVQRASSPILYTGDITRFRQLIINLLSNAIEAYPEPGKRTKQRKVILHIEQLFDATIVIGVTDWGIGIKPSQKAKVFEPFYSKKAEGTGIGLFIVKQIIEHDLNGQITLTSSSKRGTTFIIHLPVVST